MCSPVGDAKNDTGNALPTAVIIDVDGTAVDVRRIRHYVTNRSRNFDAFHRASVFCPAITDVRTIAYCARSLGHKVLLVTGRDSRYGGLTLDWLHKHKFPYDRLRLRDQGDVRPDVEVKRSILAELIKEFSIVLAVDDNPAIICLWESCGIRVARVPGWDDSFTLDFERAISVPNPFSRKTI